MAPPLGNSTLCRAFSLDSRGPDLNPNNSTTKKPVTLYGKNILISENVYKTVSHLLKKLPFKMFRGLKVLGS
jgi:hypothetical protein